MLKNIGVNFTNKNGRSFVTANSHNSFTDVGVEKQMRATQDIISQSKGHVLNGPWDIFSQAQGMEIRLGMVEDCIIFCLERQAGGCERENSFCENRVNIIPET